MEVDIQQLWSEARTVLMELGTEFGLKIVAAIAVFLIGRWVARLISNGARKVMHSNDVEDTLETFVGNLLYIVLLTVVIVASIGTLGVQVASF
ncbi:MAG: mechanosensitive ion channel family protein, partial [Pseudomonadota bacterium]